MSDDHAQGGEKAMMWDGYGFGAGVGGWLMLVSMVVLVTAAVVAHVFFVRAVSQHPAGPPQVTRVMPTAAPEPPSEAALDILKRRYAAGEIERDQYLQKLADL